MVELLEPKPTDIIGDPACGTAGFLVKVMEYLRRTYTSPDMVFNGDDGSPVYVGDQLTPYRDHIDKHMFRGFDFDQTMLRLSAMNMMLHGVAGQCIFYQDSLSESFRQNYPAEVEEHFDIILANPPFKGNLNVDDIAQELTRKVKSSRRLSEPLITIQDQRMRQPPLLEKPLPLLLHFSLSIDMR